ncbi:MAG: extracellular solute-binding protein [Bacilli bacterium]|nr:extracellular solute-binding protein [Bacilli bacterium]
MNSIVLAFLGAIIASSASPIAVNSAAKLSRKGAAITGPVNLVVKNSQDYILADDNDDDRVLIDEFIAYVKETDGVDINVSYSTFATNEVIMSGLENGSENCDLVCVSDYAVQKLMSKRFAYPFANGEAERKALYGERYDGWNDNYTEYSSPFLKQRLHNIEAKIGEETHRMDEYARGYMWGTLGITYNANFSFPNKDLTPDDVMVQMCDWNALWSDSYRQTFQIKDSMRDTYAIGLMHVFDFEFKTIRSWYLAGKDNEGASYDEEAYNRDTTIIFNNINHLDSFNALYKKIHHTEETFTLDMIINRIQSAIIELKEHSFGMEVDSGKTDITDGKKSGIDTAWSGDAILSIDGSVGDVDIYFSLPRTGGNIWFDAWALTTSDPIKQEYANKFIDFLSDPTIAARNMEWIGYTSFIAGDNILSLVREWYDPRTWAMYPTDEDDCLIYDYTTDDEGEPLVYDGTGEREVTITDEEGEEVTLTVDMGETDMRGSTYSKAVVDGEEMSWDEYWPDNYDPEEEEAWMKVDLSYFFEGSLVEFSDEDMVFYTSEMKEVTGKNLKGEEETVLVGKSFYAQYPTYDLSYKSSSDENFLMYQIPSLAVMEDYGDNNEYVVAMWEVVKSTGTLSSPVIIILIVEVVVALLIVGVLYIGKKRSKDLRKKRREARSA